MPELPEVETMRRGIASCAGSRIAAVRRPRCRLRPIRLEPGLAALRRRAVGATIRTVGRVGKRVVLELDTRDRLVFEPRMTGLVLHEGAPTREHLRLRLDLEGGPLAAVYYWDRRGLGSVQLMDPATFAARCGPPHLGPDALEVTPRLLRERLGASPRPVKVALLDQAVLAGVGNIYAAESLNVARVHPARPCASLTAAEWRAVSRALKAILEEAIRYEGSSLGDGTYRAALERDGSYQNAHRVYGREGHACRACGEATVERIVQAQRATFFCPRCQPLRVSRAAGR